MVKSKFGSGDQSPGEFANVVGSVALSFKPLQSSLLFVVCRRSIQYGNPKLADYQFGTVDFFQLTNQAITCLL